ncbi:MAG: hypothetical protein IKK39_03685, partial [Thermoguttaceae bacterium]|nr:hypothetical protein [Thermoguttaceae bacterium]
ATRVFPGLAPFAPQAVKRSTALLAKFVAERIAVSFATARRGSPPAFVNLKSALSVARVSTEVVPFAEWSTRNRPVPFAAARVIAVVVKEAANASLSTVALFKLTPLPSVVFPTLPIYPFYNARLRAAF